MTEPQPAAGDLHIDGFVTETLIVHGRDEDADAPCHFFLFKALVHGEEVIIGFAQEASAARTLRDELSKYIEQAEADLDGQLNSILGDQP